MENPILVILAIIPAVVIIAYIFHKDKIEKEPIGMLVGLFFLGCATIIPAGLAEAAIAKGIENSIPTTSAAYSFIMCFLIIAPAEEGCKFLVLRLRTWKSKNFNYTFDAIVYAVFVSLGFAGIENVGYVFQHGFGTAILRMFTSVPGHACFAVLMGFFYSRAKYAKLTGSKKSFTTNILLTLFVPSIVHGIYDAIIMSGSASGEAIITGLAALLWLGYVIAMFVVCFIIVIKSSKNDYCIVNLPGEVQTVYRPSIVGTWTCSCGSVNQHNFCGMCGSKRPLDTSWTCPDCGTLSTFKFCGNCGCPNPALQPGTISEE